MRPTTLFLAALVAALSPAPAHAGINAVFGGLHAAVRPAEAVAATVCPAPPIDALSLTEILTRLPATPL